MGSVNQVRGEEAELDDRVQEVVGRNRDGIAGEGQGLSEEDESRVVEDGKEGVVVADAVLNLNQHQQQQQPGVVVCWERFLPVRSLKILLVENDDCTRQVVSALLRNCSYEVTATENGLEAWKILQDPTNHIDLVLTEVVMPCLSGIGLLCKIMGHKTLKNIPVIMMSSHDSMGIVFKCLSKGAVDFLVKPIRKNELRNLWQHVWRRCHSSSGSGSESGIPTQKSVKSKNVESDKDTSSSSEDDNASLGANVRDGSDNGSQTQSSWTKCAAEVESPKPMSPSGHLADPTDSTCAQVIHSKNEAFRNEWIPLAGSSGCERKEILENGSTAKDLEIRVPRGSTKGCGSYPRDKVPYLSDKNLPTVKDNLMEESPLNDSKKHNHKSKGDILELNGSKVHNESSAMLPGMIGVVANDSNTQVLTKRAGPCGDTLKISTSKAKGQDDAKELPSLELSLKRSATTRDGGNVTSEDRKILRHSDLSAFSRYNTSAASNQVATAFGGSYSFRLDNNSPEGPKTESLHIPQSASDAGGLNQGSNGSSNNIDMGSTTKNSPTVAAISTEKPAIASVSKGAHVSAFHPVPHRVSGTQEVLQEKIDKLATNTVMVQPNGVHHQVQVQHHHHHYHHHHVQSMQLQHQLQHHPPQNNKFDAKITSSGALQCRSSNVLSGPMECNVANYSVNGSISGSNHGSSAAANTRALNIESDSGAGGNGGSGGGNVSGSGSREDVDKIRFARREAALNKFRQKRKERCFEKKVRYQSRKRLAEQRPRVRGQFVRQAMHEPKDNDADC